MGKGPSNGGVVANRGFIFQAIVAEIQCLERDDWDAIKVEPVTTNDKVDIMLYRDGNPLCAMQVKSSINPFERSAVKGWLEKLRADAEGAKEICLYLVGKSYKSACEDFIAEHLDEIQKVPFDYLPDICTKKLVEYIRNVGVGGEVRVDDLEFIDDALFVKLFKNSIAKEQISRAAFEERFYKALPVHIIPKCLTPIPTINHEVGLVGRDDIKKSIRSMLEENDFTALVSGLGGIGKTAVMQYICNDVKNEGMYVAWIECSDSLKNDLLALRDALGIQKSYDADQAYEKIIDEISSRLNNRLYLFMDNLSQRLDKDERNMLKSLGIHVMVTSRFKHSYFENLNLDILAKEDAIDMFYGYYRSDRERKYRSTAWDIINSVNSHTLLVELIAKAAWKKGGTLDAFREELEANGVFDVFRGKISTEHDDENLTIEESVKMLYKMSGLTKEQQHIMKLFALFTPEKVIYYKVAEWAGFDVDELDGLIELGWIERGGLENGYQLHQIVKDSLSKQVGEVNLKDYGELLDKVIDTDSYLSETVTYEFVRERILLTEDIAGYLWTAYQADSERDKKWAYDAGALLNNLARVHRVQGDYVKALAYFGKALTISERVLGTDHPNTATMYNNIAAVYEDQGDYIKALEYYGKALDIKERVLGTNHLSTATTYNNMAGLYEDQGDYEKALEYYGKDLAISECVLGTDHLDTATTYNNLAGVYEDQGDYIKALEYYGKALDIKERVLGTNHLDTATTYNNMANVYDDQGDYEKALEYHRKALAIRERVLGSEHPDTATTYNNMANVYDDQGDYEKALEYYGKALAIRERVLGTDHPDTATMYNNMAGVYHAQGDHIKALEYFGKAIDISERVLGTDHPSTATAYNNIACVYRDQSDYVKALEYYRKANSGFLSTFGENHPHTQDTQLSIMILEILLATGMTEDEFIATLQNRNID